MKDDELEIAARVVYRWATDSQLPLEYKLALRNNVFRELLALNRREAEIRQVGRETRLELDRTRSDVDEELQYPRLYLVPPYVEWHRWPEVRDVMIQERKRTLWLKLKAMQKRQRRRPHGERG